MRVSPASSRSSGNGIQSAARVLRTWHDRGMAIRIVGFDHLVLRTTDVARLVQFYCDVLGCTVEKRRDDLGLVHLRAGRSMIDLVDVAGPLGRAGGAAPGSDARNLDHLALRIESFDADAIRAQLAAAGATASQVMDNFGAEGNGPSIYTRDPDGNTIELKGPPRSQPNTNAV
jgi:catechol 2,3-dioxygenase-like lactoylglutathione lyase family enzyme